MPPGTVIVVNPALTSVLNPVVASNPPVASSAPVYDVHASPSAETEIGSPAGVSTAGIARSYDFPAPAAEPPLAAGSANPATGINPLSNDPVQGSAAAIPINGTVGNPPAR